ncbi:hypothetical protein M2132_000675 [Dysgonomonas sp. PH5-45]|uniref:hypothetical protein n=1 Tax=unclassified Dysgonomonas TaxID=2630389 RepID=UPI002476C4CD|nr:MULTISPECIES: hypothetical protein [unclassified Dysgonomonas]MDH6354347.1 hypothetical protein [Dysgonomonas sp. PH5-45]MDH6387247.1 hypothetical protein [Dysgonomonas sp. PH5-37]
MKGNTKGLLAIFTVILLVASYIMYNSSSKVKNESAVSLFVDGIVVDADKGEPLKGVSVAIRGHNPATITSDDGKFRVKALLSDELLFKKDGFLPRIIRASDVEKVVLTPAAKEDNAME